MYRLLNNEWNLALHEFSTLLIESLGPNLVMILGLDEDSWIRDSNVLVVVKKIDEQVRRLVARSALLVNDRYNCTISYYLTEEKDTETINLFKNREEIAISDCQEAFREFSKRVKDNTTRLIFLGNRYHRDSNVLVVVKKIDEQVRRLVARSALLVNDRYNCTISYYLVEEGEEELIHEFEEIGSTAK
ncbi:hypothetical protein [Metallosphaera javensis (ex Sakai et al. 2022)]|uniref:hypothetical protein n=1 Tax=Metallosphaera javensis (ex Sakai et al. 2022) TaxID=2775498 RepID=UPI00258ADBED|nr:MAG: hypothetical protein MjAS7_2947 [Metallosphaera javensis (ex Sakai et al. 2022)]